MGFHCFTHSLQETHKLEGMSVRPHVSYLKLLNGFRLNLVLSILHLKLSSTFNFGYN